MNTTKTAIKELSPDKGTTTIALVGNPNVGKSVFFQKLTGTYAEVSNYPGTTVDFTTGYFDQFRIIDTPGVYSLSGRIDEEKVTLDALKSCDFIINITDVTVLSRDLFLTLSLMQLGKPMLLVVNMMDEADRLGIQVDFALLRETLQIPVYPIAARTGRGIIQAKYAISAQHFQSPSPDFNAMDAPELRVTADRMASKVTRQRSMMAPAKSVLDLDSYFFRPFLGLFLVSFLMCLFYLIIGKLVAQHLIDFTEGYLMKTLYYSKINALLGPLFTLPALGGEDSFLNYLFLGEYGLLTMVPTYLFGLLLPMIFCFYIVFSFLEDLGILPRISVLTDRFLRYFGLNGKAIIPIGLGFGCVTMALISTRILESRRERVIASILLAIAVPCSAQFVVIASVASTLSVKLLLFYVAVVSLVFGIIGVACNLLLPGKTTALFMVLPPLRFPSMINVLQKTARKTKQFLSDAGLLFLLGGLLFSLLGYYNGFPVLYHMMAPLTTSLLGLPEQTSGLFLFSMLKRDLGAAQLHYLVAQGLFTPEQTVIILLVITFFMPCFASLAVLFQEQGLKIGSFLFVVGIVISFGIGAMAAAVLT